MGNWLAYPDSRLGRVEDDLVWLRRGFEGGLFDGDHVLVVVGWGEGTLDLRAYSADQGEPTALACSLLPRP